MTAELTSQQCTFFFKVRNSYSEYSVIWFRDTHTEDQGDIIYRPEFVVRDMHGDLVEKRSEQWTAVVEAVKQTQICNQLNQIQ